MLKELDLLTQLFAKGALRSTKLGQHMVALMSSGLTLLLVFKNLQQLVLGMSSLLVSINVLALEYRMVILESYKCLVNVVEVGSRVL